MDKKATDKIVVIGAGPAGLTAAYELCKKGFDVEVFEASNYVGGMARSFDLWGQRVDCGPHRFFSSDKIVNDLFKEVIKDEYTLVNRLTRIYYKNKFFYYPLKISNVLKNLSPLEVLQILSSYAKQALNPIKNPKTFEEWVTNKFGFQLFTIFFKHYSEKLWGIPCSKIDADWAAQRIKKLNVYEVVKGALFGDKENKHKTLLEQFAYPKEGTGTLYVKMAEFITANGGKIHLNTPVGKICLNENNEAIGIGLKDGTIINSEKVISTMPMTSMVKGLENVPEKVIEATNRLYFRNTTLVYLEVNSTDLFPDNWVYVHSPEVQHGRITNFRNWCTSIIKGKNTSILCLEFWSFDTDKIWNETDEYLQNLAKEEVKKIKLVPQEAEITNAYVLKVPKCYPVYETGYQEHLDVVTKFLDAIKNLKLIGRYGSFKYNNQDHSILMGILAAREIATGVKENLWEINTDTEYQEKGEVNKSGL
jgi:protoporphyrinogen oxidase